MGFLDKVKEQATAATAVAKDAAQKGQAKLSEVQGKKAADALLRDLGAATYAQQTGRGTAFTGGDIERLNAALADYEGTHGQISLVLESAVGAPGGPPADDGSGTPAPAPPAASTVQTAPSAAATMPPPSATPMAPPSGSTL